MSAVKVAPSFRSSVNVPAIRTADDDSLSGRGLAWVDRLAVAWGADHDEAGGTVWFRLPYDGSLIF